MGTFQDLPVVVTEAFCSSCKTPSSSRGLPALVPGVQDLGPGTWRGPTATPPPVASRQGHRLLPGTALAFCSPSRPKTAHRPSCSTHTHQQPPIPRPSATPGRDGRGGTPLLHGSTAAAGILESYYRAPGTLLQGLEHDYRLLTVQASAVQPLAGRISEATWFFLQSSDMSLSNYLNLN